MAAEGGIMQATINDIRRGDRFTWSGRTWIAAADAHPNTWGINGAVDIVTLPGNLKPGTDGVIRQETPSQLQSRAVHFTAPVTIIERDVQISLTHEDAPVVRRRRTATESSLRLVEHLVKKRRALDQAVSEADQEFGDLIRMALANGASVAQLTEKTGLSRARIYQIRDGRR